MRIEVSDSLWLWLEKQARLEGHATADAYVDSLLQQQRAHCELKRVRLDQPQTIEVTPEMWEQRRRVLEEWL